MKICLIHIHVETQCSFVGSKISLIIFRIFIWKISHEKYEKCVCVMFEVKILKTRFYYREQREIIA